MLVTLIRAISALILGTIFYIPMRLVMLRMMNWMIVNYPQWGSGDWVSFYMASINWGLLIFIYVPVAIWFWSNAQRERDIA